MGKTMYLHREYWTGVKFLITCWACFDGEASSSCEEEPQPQDDEAAVEAVACCSILKSSTDCVEQRAMRLIIIIQHGFVFKLPSLAILPTLPLEPSQNCQYFSGNVDSTIIRTMREWTEESSIAAAYQSRDNEVRKLYNNIEVVVFCCHWSRRRSSSLLQFRLCIMGQTCMLSTRRSRKRKLDGDPK